MRLNWPMILRAGHRLTMKEPGHLRDLAHQTIELAPEETKSAPAALYPPDALEKVVGLSPWRSWPVETALINGEAITHAATKAHVVKDVSIFGPMVYKHATKYDAGFGAERIWRQISGPARIINDAVLVSCFAGSRFFGPFLKDSLPLELLPDEGAHMIGLRTKTYGHETGYRTLFGLPAPSLVDHAHVRHLTFHDDVGQNSGKAARYQTLRDRLRLRLKVPSRQPPKGIYLKRGKTGEARLLTNEAVIEDHLAKLGFDIVEPATLSADEIARRTLDAPIVVSVEGSHMSHVVYSMAASGTLLVLQPPDRFAMAFKEFTDQIGIRFAFFVGDPDHGGFAIDPSAFSRFVERVMP